MASTLRTHAVSILLSGMLIAFLLLLLGIQVSVMGFVGLMVAMLALAAFARSTVDVQLGFMLVGFAMLLLLYDWFAPGAIKEAFSPAHQLWVGVTGIDLGELNALYWFIIIFVFVFTMIFLRLRLSGQKKFADTAADRAMSNILDYFRRYGKIARLAIFMLFGVAIIILSQGAELFGEMGSTVADAPVVVSNLVAIFAGYASLGGDVPFLNWVPIIGDLSAGELLIFGLIVLIIAAAVRWESSGPLSRSLRNR